MSENSEKKQESGVMYIIPRWMVWVVVVFICLNGLICGFIWGIAPEMRDRIIQQEVELLEMSVEMKETQIALMGKQIRQERTLADNQQLLILMMNNNTNLIAELNPLEEKAFNSAKSNLERVNTKYENWEAMLLRGATPEELGYGTNGYWEKAKIFNLDGTPKAERN